MADYRTMFEGKYVGAWNLIDRDGNRRDVTITIAKVEAGEIVGEGGKKNKKPVVHFTNGWLPMVCGKTVAKTIAKLYGNDTKNWVGKRITLFSTTTEVGGETKDCIRVRPTIPQVPNRTAPNEPPPQDPESPKDPPPDAPADPQ